jgi:hypothetical protein
LLAFHYHEKIPEVVHFNEPLRFSLVHTFGNFTPWSIGSIAFGPVVRQNFMAGTHGGANCLPHGGKEAKREGKTRVLITPASAVALQGQVPYARRFPKVGPNT